MSGPDGMLFAYRSPGADSESECGTERPSAPGYSPETWSDLGRIGRGQLQPFPVSSDSALPRCDSRFL